MAAEVNGVEEKKKRFSLGTGIDVKMVGIGLGIFVVAVGISYFIMRSLLAGLVVETTSAPSPVEIVLVEVGDFTTNIVNTTRYVRVQVAVSVAVGHEELATQFMPVIKDTVLSVLSQKSATQLSANNTELKDDIMDNINDRLETNLIEGVFFTNFIMQ
jgi:flagellar FliL protein